MALRCLTSLEANNKTVNLLRLTSEAMASIWETNRSDYNWYNSTSSAPTEYIVSEGDDILEDLFTRDWMSSGETDYTISNSRNSYFFKKYDTQVGSRNSVGIQPYDYGSTNIYGRYQQGELAILHYQYAIIIDDENEEAVIVFYQTRNGSGYSTFYRFTIYTGTNYRHTLWLDFTDAEPQTKITSNGGGATHIAKITGQLKDLSSNLSDILMVSGGGGGGLLVGETDYSGKEAGGISGSGDNSADQSTGNAFGQGESGTNVSGGGSGLYGGYKGTSSKSGGAGSGYIGNSLLSNKKMVGYNVPTSSAEGTKTESVNVFDSNYVAEKPKAGNGHARIKYLATYKEYTFEELIKTDDLTHYKETWVGPSSIDDNWSTLSQWLDTDWNLTSQNGYGTYQLVKDDDEYVLGSTYSNAMSLYALPLKNKVKVKAIIFDGKFNTLTNNSQSQMHLRMGCTNNGVHSIVGALTVSQGDGYDYKVTDTNYHTFIKQFNSVETNYLEFYNGQYKDYFKNIKVIVEE